LGQPFTFAVTLASAIWLSLLSRIGLDLPQAPIAMLQRLMDEKKIEAMRLWAGVYDGWLLAQQGRVAEGIEVMRRTLSAAGRAVGVPGLLAVMARTCLDAGLYDEGLAALADGLALLNTGIGRHSEPETYRLLGALTLGKRGPLVADSAESWFRKALQVARDTGALSWELRAGVDLARLWREQGQAARAQELLTAIYGRFTEGFDTPDLREAAALLDELRACM
jgi:predicted ATPase